MYKIRYTSLFFSLLILTGCAQIEEVQTIDKNGTDNQVKTTNSSSDNTKDVVVLNQQETNAWTWDGSNEYVVFAGDDFKKGFPSFIDAVNYAKAINEATVYFRGNKDIVWENPESLPSFTNLIDAPIIAQLPELPRGCEVTSLSMMLQTAGLPEEKVNKTKLGKEIKRDPTPFKKENGKIYFGNPYDGFVGDMYSFKTPGYGVYHGPLAELAENYLPNRVIDMTGSDFKDILYPVSKGRPVFVIHNAWFKKLPESQFQTWYTPTGEVKITMREHAVLITGYDENYIYFNDPLANVKNRKAEKKDFIEGWIQIGSQAITYIE